MFDSMEAALEYIFRTRRRLGAGPRGLDENSRDVSATRRLLKLAGLPASRPCECVVVAGSRGKGSVASMMAKLLEGLGYRTGLLTSPHLLRWNERIRVDGRMIADDDFLRILRGLRPPVDAVVAGLDARAYLSPQGIFLAIALQYFAERAVDIAVLEVGRGGRFDDIAAVPHKMAVITPIMLEHTALLGDTLERIAWHKAGVIPSCGAAFSAVQRHEADSVLRHEAQKRGANLAILEEGDSARWVRDVNGGQVIHLRPYGELHLPLLGAYQMENATLAIRAVEKLHALRKPMAGSSADFRAAIRAGLARVQWLGRVQRLADNPVTYVDGAITVPSAESFVASLRPRLTEPVVAIVGVPRDREFAGVYCVMAGVSSALVITETDINPNTRFPTREAALKAAAGLGPAVYHSEKLPDALAIARDITGEAGTILLALSLMLVGECMLLWDVDTEQI